MMAADYDNNTRSFDHPQVQSRGSRDPYYRPREFQHGSGGKGKGRHGGHHRHHHPSNIQEYILPEMVEDPWISLYHHLPDPIRELETKHLTGEEMDRVECNLQLYPPAKRHNLD
jgi:hypothetical protein